MVSYASSPPYEVAKGAATAPTGALLDTCFRQIEYTGVLAGAKNPAAAQKVVDWLLSPQFQAQIPENMYVYPVDKGTPCRPTGPSSRRWPPIRPPWPRPTSTPTGRPGSAPGPTWCKAEPVIR